MSEPRPFQPPEPRAGPIVVEMDPEIIGLVPVFLEHRRRDLEELRRAVEAGDAEAMEDVGHRMKGIGDGYGFSWVSVAGTAIEDLAREGRLEEIRPWIEGLADYMERIVVRKGPPREEP